MNEKPSSFELLEPRNPEALVPASWIEPWMIYSAVAVILLLVFLFLYLRKKTTVADPLAYRNAAYQEAAAALEIMVSPDVRDAAIRSSLVVRKYLSIAAEDPALYETHEEFIMRQGSLQALNQAARDASASGFARLATLKYAAEVPDIDPRAVVTDSRALLEALHHGFLK